MIRKSILSLLLAGWSMFVFGQEFEIVSMEEKSSDHSAQIHQRNDANGTTCGMVRVLLNEPDVKFEGSYVVGDYEFFTAGYNLYLATGAKKFTVKHENYYPLEISVQNFGIKSIESGKTYELTLVSKATSAGKKGEETVDGLTKKAEQSDPIAQYQLAKLFANGADVDQDYDTAIKWYQKAAENGNTDAQYDLGMLYYYGQGINKDYSKAKELIAKAADANNMYAQFRLGVMYEHGFGVSTDFKKSYEYYKRKLPIYR